MNYDLLNADLHAAEVEDFHDYEPAWRQQRRSARVLLPADDGCRISIEAAYGMLVEMHTGEIFDEVLGLMSEDGRFRLFEKLIDSADRARDYWRSGGA